MRLAELTEIACKSLLSTSDLSYARAMASTVKSDGFGLLSDRFLPGLSTGQVPRERLVRIIKATVETNDEFVRMHSDDLKALVKAIAAENKTTTETELESETEHEQ